MLGWLNFVIAKLCISVLMFEFYCHEYSRHKSKTSLYFLCTQWLVLSSNIWEMFIVGIKTSTERLHKLYQSNELTKQGKIFL